MENSTYASDKWNNTSSSSTINETINETSVEPIYIFTAIIYSVAFLLGTTGNGLVIWFATMKMKKTVNVTWFLNLAIADFIFTFFQPLNVVYIALSFHWPFGRFMCKFGSFVLNLNLFASVFQLTVISMDRCISVVYPVWCKNYRTPTMALFVVLIVWFLAFVFGSPYFVFQDIDVDDATVWCFYKFTEDHWMSPTAQSRHRDLLMTKLFVSFVIPFAIIVSCYTVITSRIQRNHWATSSKPFKLIVVVIISFFVCWIPLHVFSFLELYAIYGTNDDLQNMVGIGFPLANSLACLNSCVNPILYVYIGRDFQKKFRRSIRSVFAKAFMEHSDLTDFRSTTKSMRASESL